MSNIAILRSILCVPAINGQALAKLKTLACDAVIFDLEDSVALTSKQQARENLERFFASGRPAGYKTAIRVNPLNTEIGREDMRTVLACQPDAVLLPKVETIADLATASTLLSRHGAPLRVRLWAMLETPVGIINAAAIAGAYSAATSGGRLETLIVGVNDLRSTTRVLETPGRVHLVPWLMQVVLAARGYGLSVIDGVYNDFTNSAGFDEECAAGCSMGFDGKMLIHPSQIDTANFNFSPSPAAILEARAIIAAFAKPGAQELNVIELNGCMVERLHLEQAEVLLARAQSVKPTKDAS